MTCQTCTHWQPKRADKMARLGYGCCALTEAWRTLAPSHTCAKHKQADAPVVAARAMWLERINQKHTGKKK